MGFNSGFKGLKQTMTQPKQQPFADLWPMNVPL